MENKTGRQPRANTLLCNMLRGMKNRCYYSNQRSHLKNYRAKGIRICEQWRASGAAFDRWALDNGWKPGLTIDRIDPDGHYEPDNCQFITIGENVRRSSAAHLTWDQVKEIRARYIRRKNTGQLCSEFGIRSSALNDIINYRSWQVDER